MTTVLVPYDHAMRLGMGFNTYTHALCINDAVTKPGKVPASEEDLVNKPDWGNISQQVTYTTKYVDKVSDVLSSLNISGSLEIKLSALGAGGQAKASFIDTKKFKESDLNFLVQVKVANSKLIADDVTEFCPIDNVIPSQFTEVYGDGFISGFVEGGELNGLVSVKLRDSSKSTDIQASLKINAPFAGGAVNVSGEGDLSMQEAEADTEGEKTVSVAWSGGGDVKPPEATEWTVEALKGAAYNFPSRVAVVPQRTYAIVTKYTSLRSFQAQTVRGTPLDYENAGTYTSALLEAYLEYKSIWTDIQLSSWNLEHDLVTLAKRPENPSMVTYRNTITENYKNQTSASNSDTQVEANGGTNSNGFLTVQARDRNPPLPPNEVKPYEPDLFGLDKAHTDCRFEMIKIVREVDEVTFDPKVAIDPMRRYQYLSPQVFRLLIPFVLDSSMRTNDAPLSLDNTRFRVFDRAIAARLWSYSTSIGYDSQCLTFWKSDKSDPASPWLIYNVKDKIATVQGEHVMFVDRLPGAAEQEWWIGGSTTKNGLIRIMNRKNLRFIAVKTPTAIADPAANGAEISLEADSSQNCNIDLELTPWDTIPVAPSTCSVSLVSKGGAVLGSNTYHQQSNGNSYDIYETQKRPGLPDKKSKVLSNITRTNMAVIAYLDESNVPQVRLFIQNGSEIQEHCADIDHFFDHPTMLTTVTAPCVPLSAIATRSQDNQNLFMRVLYWENNKFMQIEYLHNWREPFEVKSVSSG